MKNGSFIAVFFISALLLSASFAYAGDCCKKDSTQGKMKHAAKAKTESATAAKAAFSIVHTGIIDLQAIDANKDGKVFQDQMDWNVISDKAGKCPLCGMKLKEVTLKEAKANLVKNGLKVK